MNVHNYQKTKKRGAALAWLLCASCAPPDSCNAAAAHGFAFVWASPFLIFSPYSQSAYASIHAFSANTPACENAEHGQHANGHVSESIAAHRCCGHECSWAFTTGPRAGVLNSAVPTHTCTQTRVKNHCTAGCVGSGGCVAESRFGASELPPAPLLPSFALLWLPQRVLTNALTARCLRNCPIIPSKAHQHCKGWVRGYLH